MADLHDFHEAAAEPVEASLRVALQVRPTSIWVGVYRLDGSAHGGGTHVWSRKYVRPDGKTTAECVEACLRAALRAQEGGELVA